MDDIVSQAMRKWPHVPACYGWLGLDGRGQWWMRDDRTQQLGTFQAAHQHHMIAAKGALLKHDKLVAFIGRNYDHDDQGQWFFQNGPQRVYVELTHTPWIFRVGDAGEIATHTGQVTTVLSALVDEMGHLYLHTPLGVGLVHTQDIWAASHWMKDWPQSEVLAAELPKRFAYQLSPQQHQKAVISAS